MHSDSGLALLDAKRRLVVATAGMPEIGSAFQAAIESALAQPPSLILLDVRMPEMDGITATRCIRDEVSPELQPYIIAVTANASKENKKNCLEAGMDAFLAKPLKIDRLEEELARAVDTSLVKGERSTP